MAPAPARQHRVGRAAALLALMNSGVVISFAIAAYGLSLITHKPWVNLAVPLLALLIVVNLRVVSRTYERIIRTSIDPKRPEPTPHIRTELGSAVLGMTPASARLGAALFRTLGSIVGYSMYVGLMFLAGIWLKGPLTFVVRSPLMISLLTFWQLRPFFVENGGDWNMMHPPEGDFDRQF